MSAFTEKDFYRQTKLNPSMKFKVFRTSTFEKEFSKLSKTEQTTIEKFEKKLVENPHLGNHWATYFSEKRS